MTNDRLREIRERLTRATKYRPLPWVEDNTEDTRQVVDAQGDWVCKVIHMNPAKLLVHAPADIDYLLGEVERMGEVYRTALAFYEAADEDMTSEETVDMFEACEKAREATK